MTDAPTFWDRCDEGLRKLLWRQGDPRVPTGWQPGKRRGNMPSRWEDITPAYRLRLYNQGSPRVPAGWRPPTYVAPTTTWDDLTPHSQRRLYNQGSQRVPAGWHPPPLIRFRRRLTKPPVPNSDWGYPEVVVVDIRTLPPGLPEPDIWRLLSTGWTYAHIIPRRVRFVSGEVRLGELPNPLHPANAAPQ